MLAITIDPKSERLEITVGDIKVVLFMRDKVKVGVIAPSEVKVRRVKHEPATLGKAFTKE